MRRVHPSARTTANSLFMIAFVLILYNFSSYEQMEGEENAVNVNVNVSSPVSLPNLEWGADFSDHFKTEK